MAQQESLLYIITIGGVAVSCATGLTTSRETDTEAPPVCKGSAASNWETPGRGAKRFLSTLTGVVDFASTYGVAQLKTAHDDNVDIVVVFGTGISGDPRETITCIVASVGEDASGIGKMTYDANLIGLGAPVIDTFV